MTATVSVDGRIALHPDRILLDPAVGAVWSSLHPAGATSMIEERTQLINRQHRPQAVLNGSGSFTTGMGSPLPSFTGDPRELLADFLPDDVADGPHHERWFVVADGRGRARWHTKSDGGYDLLILVARSTPSEYLAYLRREHVCYLVTGEARVDLNMALERMRVDLGIECVVADGGGELNGALLRGGLVDQLEIVVLPLAIGGKGTPSLFDGRLLGPDELPTALELTATRVTDDGAIWLSYEVAPDVGPAGGVSRR